MQKIEERLNEMERKMAGMIAGLAVLQVVIGGVLAYMKH